jgi:hypothetical protein
MMNGNGPRNAIRPSKIKNDQKYEIWCEEVLIYFSYVLKNMKHLIFFLLCVLSFFTTQVDAALFKKESVQVYDLKNLESDLKKDYDDFRKDCNRDA